MFHASIFILLAAIATGLAGFGLLEYELAPALRIASFVLTVAFLISLVYGMRRETRRQ
jgi:hypothetical protein